MIDLENLKVLFFILPLLVLCLAAYQIHKKSWVWISENISNRFRENFTKYKNLNYLKIHLGLFFLMILILSLATATPYLVGEIELNDDKGKIFIILDGSFSMLPADTNTNPKTGKKPYDRLAEEQEFAEELVDLLPEYSFGVISFSKLPVVHTNLTDDSVQVKTIIRTMLLHNFENTGSSFKSAFAEFLRLSYQIDGNLQVVLLSDGEVPEGHEEDLTKELNELRRNKIPVHTVGIGTEAGGSVEFFISYKEDKKIDNLAVNEKSDSTGTKKVQVRKEVIKSIWTKRDNTLLKKISDETDGLNLVIEKKGSPEKLAEEIKRIVAKTKNKRRSEGQYSLTPYFLIFALILFLFERLFFLRKMAWSKK